MTPPSAQAKPNVAPRPALAKGVRLLGTGSSVPPKTLSNADLEKLMDTSDEWIVQRTGIRNRRIVDPAKGESTRTLAAEALSKAVAAAGLKPTDLDLVVCATMTPEMMCPPTAVRIAHALGCGPIGAFDLGGACCGYVFALNVVHDLIRAGAHKTIGLIGADTLSTLMDYSTAGRGTSIIFGDAAAACVFQATDDPSRGILAQAMHSDGTGWKDIYVPQKARDFPPGVDPDPNKMGHVQMNGSTVFKFAVGTFPNLIQETLDKVGLKAADVDMYVCHQSNARILTAARDRFGLPDDRFYINIDRYGNTVAASVPLCLDELVRAGRVRLGDAKNPGSRVMFVAFGGGLTWGSSLWQL